jgi:hypothetical protein
MALDPYRGPMSVWDRIVLGHETEPTLRMEIGSALEAPIARLWARRSGERIRLNHRTLVRGNLAATVDAFALDRHALVEIKWSTSAGLWADGLPEHVRIQAVAQSYVYRRPTVIVVALVGGDLREYLVEPTRSERREVRDAVDLFMERHVETGQIPLPLWPGELAVFLRLTQGTDPKARRAASEAEQAAATAYLTARAQAQTLAREADALRAELLGLIAAGGSRPRIIGDDWTAVITEDRITVNDLRPSHAAPLEIGDRIP